MLFDFVAIAALVAAAAFVVLVVVIRLLLLLLLLLVLWLCKAGFHMTMQHTTQSTTSLTIYEQDPWPLRTHQ